MTDRHKGHCDEDNLDEWKPVLEKGKIEAITIKGETFDLDTTKFEEIDYEKLFEFIENNLQTV